MTSTQLARVDVGSWFNRAHPRLAREEYRNQYVPTLAQVLELCRETTTRSVYIELKSEDTGLTADLVDCVADVMKKLTFNHRSIVVSFDLDALVAIKQREPSIRTGALFAPARSGGRWRSEAFISAAIQAGAGEILLHRLLARRKSVEKALVRNLSVVVWTVDDPKWVSRAESLGITALVTNDPEKLLRHRP